jgi:hypothetical protein
MNEVKRTIYKDKDGYWKVYVGREFPFGTHMGRFNTKEEAEQAVKERPDDFNGGIPLCDALKDWRRDHGVES